MIDVSPDQNCPLTAQADFGTLWLTGFIMSPATITTGSLPVGGLARGQIVASRRWIAFVLVGQRRTALTAAISREVYRLAIFVIGIGLPGFSRQAFQANSFGFLGDIFVDGPRRWRFLTQYVLSQSFRRLFLEGQSFRKQLKKNHAEAVNVAAEVDA